MTSRVLDWRSVRNRKPAIRRPKKKVRRQPSPPAGARRPEAREPARREQPLGVGVGDAHAVKRLGIPPRQSRARPQSRVREISWAQFGDIARDLAEHVGRSYRPQVVLGVVNGGVFVGGALAVALQAEMLPVKIEKRSRIAGEKLPSLEGRKVLVVDDVTSSGDTLSKATALALQAGAAEVRTAALVVRPRGHKTDYHAIETDEIVVFGWDYQLQADPGPGSSDPGEVGV